MNGCKYKCSVYVRNRNYSPSSYYRIIQYIPKLEKNGIDINVNESLNDCEFKKNLNNFGKWWRKIYQAILWMRICNRRKKQILEDLRTGTKVIFVQREAIPHFMPKAITRAYVELCKKNKVIWDYDDDIFSSNEISATETDILLKNSDVIQGIGEYSKSLIPKEYRYKYVAIPTTDGSSEQDAITSSIQEKKIRYEKAFDIVWVGTVSNLSNIDLVIDAVEDAAKQLKAKNNKWVRLIIVCNVPYEYQSENIEIVNIKWTREEAKNQIRRAHLGIMPFVNGLYQKGKGGFKLIQYLSESVPVIASDVGFCREVVTDECGIIATDTSNWKDGIIKMATDIQKWMELSEGAYKRYKERFDIDNNSAVLLDNICAGINRRDIVK